MRHLRAQWRRAAGVSDPVPPEPGQSPIPPGTVRMYHVTPLDNLDSILRNGLTLDNARGTTYGEPNLIWFSNNTDYWNPYHGRSVMLEVAIPTSVIEEAGFALIGGPGGNMGTPFDIPSDWIVAVHEPWHGHYRYVETSGGDPDVLDGLREMAETDEQYARALEVWERNHP